VDAVYEWRNVLGAVNNIFRDEQIQVDDSAGHKRQLGALTPAIERSVPVCDSKDVAAVHVLSTSERYGNDLTDGDTNSRSDVGAAQTVVTQQSAVLPSASSDGNSLASRIIDALLGVLSDSNPVRSSPRRSRKPG
jgi:hypothetical protein